MTSRFQLPLSQYHVFPGVFVNSLPAPKPEVTPPLWIIGLHNFNIPPQHSAQHQACGKSPHQLVSTLEKVRLRWSTSFSTILGVLAGGLSCPYPTKHHDCLKGERTVPEDSQRQREKNWCPYKKRERVQEHRCEERKGLVRTQREDSHLQAKERGVGRNQTCQHLDLGLPASRTVSQRHEEWLPLESCQSPADPITSGALKSTSSKRRWSILILLLLETRNCKESLPADRKERFLPAQNTVSEQEDGFEMLSQ
ncbi:uncharacterized protein [Macaca nemestrina]|uniref:uncharacterized protein n=1 Tax=Macaca nemestrina TaxID=9545 RepID=UPI0039B909A3